MSYKYLYFIAFVLFIMAGQWLIETLGQHHYEIEKATEVFDLAHRYLPDLHAYEWVINIIPALLLLFLLSLDNGTALIRNTFLMYALVLIIRVLTALTTILPKHTECTVRSKFFNIFQGGGCYDKIFSGHMALVTIIVLNLMRGGYLGMVQTWSILGLEAAALLLTRGHYTVDVVLGFLIAYLVWDGDYTIVKHIFRDLKA
jgi:hypothetical protein